MECLSELGPQRDHGGTTHGRVNTQRMPIFGRTQTESANYLVQSSCLVIILLLVDNDRFDHYLYNGNSSNQEGNLARGDELQLRGTLVLSTPLHHSDNSSQIWHLIMTKVSTHRQTFTERAVKTASSFR